MRLDDYPTSTPALFNVRISYRECFPYNFVGPSFEDLKINAGDTSEPMDFFMD